MKTDNTRILMIGAGVNGRHSLPKGTQPKNRGTENHQVLPIYLPLSHTVGGRSILSRGETHGHHEQTRAAMAETDRLAR